MVARRKKELATESGYMAHLSTKETSAIEQNRSNRGGKKKAAERFIHE